MNIYSILKQFAAAACCAITLLHPTSANAQVGYVADLMLSNICLTQNWDTPAIQSLIAEFPLAERLDLFNGLFLSKPGGRCLMQKKAAPVATCDKVVASLFNRSPSTIGGGPTFLELTQDEEESVLASLEGSGCDLDDVNEESAWLPPGLKPAPTTLAFLARAEHGTAADQLHAAELYLQGQEVRSSFERVEYWLRKAIKGGSTKAQYELGNLLYGGKLPGGVDKNEALQLLTDAANDGSIPAMRAVGSIYFSKENSVHHDVRKALAWFEKAADLEDTSAAETLAQIHEFGNQVPKNAVLAFTWYQVAAKHSPKSMRKLSELYQEGKGTSQDGIQAQQWRRKADSLGENGFGITLTHYFPWPKRPSSEQAIAKIQLKYAERGDLDAQLAVAKRYMEGEGFKKNPADAEKWLHKAAVAGDPIGQRLLGKCLIHGIRELRVDKREGWKWIRKAANQGDAEAQEMISVADPDYLEEADELKASDTPAASSKYALSPTPLRVARQQNLCRSTALSHKTTFGNHAMGYCGKAR